MDFDFETAGIGTSPSAPVAAGIGTSPSSPKPGWRTSEFWLTVAASVVYFVLSSGAFADTSPVVQVLGLVATLLSALGYTASRTLVKRG